MEKDKLIILCGPSGSGKTSVAHHLLQQMPELSFSISATTRQRREGEEDGRDYHFLKAEDFLARIAANEFVEYEEVYQGTFYGTLKSELKRIWDEGQIPLLDIDVVGALNIKNTYAPNALSVFVHPVNLDNIRQRLKKRATETEESFDKRITRAVEELNMCSMFDVVIYNDRLETACHTAEQEISRYLQQEMKVQ